MPLATIITLARLPLLLLVVGFLFIPCGAWQLAGLALLIVLFLMDWFDGYVARRRHEVSDLGAVLDVALDRAVENILWVAFLALGMVPLWVPIVFLIRSFVVDGIRGAALSKGQSVFGMMHSPWGQFLVASRFMRAFYGLAKAVALGQLYLTHALKLSSPGVILYNQILVYLAVSLCVIRGIPVLLDGRLYFTQGNRGN